MDIAVSPAPVSKLLIRSAWISFFVSILVLSIKTYGYFATHSESILSDAIESVVNVLTSIVTLFVMRAVAEPADEEHPYGHGKLEFFSAAFEGGFIVFGAIAIFYSAIESFMIGSHFFALELGLWSMGAATVINLLLSLHLFSVGRRHQSEAIVASAKHIMSDVVTTVGVLLGLVIVTLTGWKWLDGTMAIMIAMLLVSEGVKIVRRSAGGLIDETDKTALKKLSDAFEKHHVDGFIDIHKLRVIRSGRFHHVDAHMVVPEFWTVAQSHIETHRFEQAVLQDYPFEGEIAFHLDPCKRELCRTCSVNDCPIRQEKFQKRRKYSELNLIKPLQSDEEYLSSHA